MATKANLQVIGANKDGSFTVQGKDATSVQVLAAAIGRVEGLNVIKAWPRRKGGRDYPELRHTTLAESKPHLEAAMGKENRISLGLAR
jgi:hypothetical protein